MHTIHETARPTEPRQPGRAAFTARGERIVKRHTGPTALPIGTTIIEADGIRCTRVEGGWQLTDKQGHLLGQVFSAIELTYPIVEVKPKQRGHHLDRTERRRDERAARKAEAKLTRFKRNRVDAYLAATASAGIDEQRARAVAGVEK